MIGDGFISCTSNRTGYPHGLAIIYLSDSKVDVVFSRIGL